MQVLDIKTLTGTRDLFMARRDSQAKVLLMEHFEKIMSNPMARTEVSGIVIQIMFEAVSHDEVGNPLWAITIR